MKYVGTNVKRVDAYDKVTGRAKFTDDLCPKNAYVAKVLHATIAHGYVKAIHTEEAERLPGVVKILTCFDAPKHTYPTDGHIWHLDPPYDHVDRTLLSERVRYYGEDIAAVVAEDSVTADRALRLLRVEYEELPFALWPEDAVSADAAQLFADKAGNLCGEHHSVNGAYEQVIADPELLCFDNWYHTPTVQHCHIENNISYAYQEGDKLVVVASTQIPHIVRRVVGQALGIDWGRVRVIKPYIGGGFGNKQDALYEPLCAWLCTQVGGRCVKLDCSREETFVSNRVRHAFDMRLVTHVRRDGKIMARRMELWSRQGAYTSHGHGVAENAVGAFLSMYPCDASKVDAYTVYTNSPVAGAMRGYGFPQVMFAGECQIEEIARKLGIDAIALRRQNMMAVGYRDEYTKNEMYQDSLNQCIDKGMELFRWNERKAACEKQQDGSVRRGVGMAIFWYSSGVWPFYVESASCRMTLNQDGSIQLQLPETEIGQGADTVFSQMAADAVGVPLEQIHIVTVQDTDVTPFGTGAYGSRQTFVTSFSIRQTADAMRARILDYAHQLTHQPIHLLALEDGRIISAADGSTLLTLKELAMQAIYNKEHSQHITAETTADVKHNAYNFGCSFAEVEVDIPLCKVKLVDMLNVHDCGVLINPALAEAQVHGGMSMSIGYALGEQLQFDPKTGRVLNNNFLDYKLSTAMDHPNLQAAFVQNVEPTSGFGNRALGEAPACSGAPAIRNAVYHATGVAFNRIPMTPHILFERFREEGMI